MADGRQKHGMAGKKMTGSWEPLDVAPPPTVHGCLAAATQLLPTAAAAGCCNLRRAASDTSVSPAPAPSTQPPTLCTLKKSTKTLGLSTIPWSAPCLSQRRPSCQHPGFSTLPQTAREGPAGSIQLSASGYSGSSRIRIQVERRWLDISVNSTCPFLLTEMVLKTWRQRRAPRQAASQALNSCQHSHTSLLPSTGVAAATLPPTAGGGTCFPSS